MSPEKTADRPRVIGVDVARGLALFGMMAVHVFDTFNDDGTPTAATIIAGGRSSATFVFVAGVSLALMSGGRTVARGRDRTAVAASLAVRALLIGAIGFALSFAQPDQVYVNVILPSYALLFLLTTDVLQEDNMLLYALMVEGVLAFALLWRRLCRQGPLERLVAMAANGAGRAVADRLRSQPARHIQQVAHEPTTRTTPTALGPALDARSRGPADATSHVHRDQTGNSHVHS